MDHDFANEVQSVIKATLAGLLGYVPEKGSYRPSAETQEMLLDVFEKDMSEILRYCTDAVTAHMCRHKSHTPPPFFINRHLFSEGIMEDVMNRRATLSTERADGSSLGFSFAEQVKSQIRHTEYEYLTLASEYYYRDMPFDWSVVIPSLYWHVLIAVGIKEFPCNRMPPGMEIPQIWYINTPLTNGVYEDVEPAVSRVRSNLKDKDVRMVFVTAAREAIYEATRQWASTQQLIVLYKDGNRQISISPEFSKLKAPELEVTTPLAERDERLFSRAKEELTQMGKTFPPLTFERTVKPEDLDAHLPEDGIYEQHGNFDAMLATLADDKLDD